MYRFIRIECRVDEDDIDFSDVPNGVKAGVAQLVLVSIVAANCEETALRCIKTADDRTCVLK